MSRKQYFYAEIFLLAILIGLCISLYNKKSEMKEVNTAHLKPKKVCYLTFDDGPSNHTEKILDILKEYEIKATFFVIGKELNESRKEVLVRMQKEGHAIGLHSYVHDFDKVYENSRECLADFEKEYKELKENYGIDTRIFRFPGGSACSYMRDNRKEYISLMQENGYQCFDWNVSGEDSYGNPTVWSIQNNILSNCADYSSPIILLHDANIAKVTVEALPGILQSMKSDGYSFETLEGVDEYIYR